MSVLKIAATEDSPEIILDPSCNRFEFIGESRPENAAKFYGPVLKWFENYESILFFNKSNSANISAVSFVFRFEYFNSTSAKYIMDILKKIEGLHAQKYPVDIEWDYDKMDEDMLEAGQEWAKQVNVPFRFVSRD